MVFSSLVFLCAFLPVCFLLEKAMPNIKLKNAVLIVASLLFYAYGEPVLVLLMIASTLLNYVLGLLVGRDEGPSRKVWLILAVVINLGMLGVFKYAGMVVSTVNAIAGAAIPQPNIPLPLGISFYTFQALSYVIDVYRGDVVPQRNYAHVLLYVSFFPQLIAGPIVKYHDIEQEISCRHATTVDVAEGFRRFCLGLSKKVLIANTMAATADSLFALAPSSMGALGAWQAGFAYFMQIYFDFSGYSDMAIGLGRAFGFHFKENFDHPYASTSIKEFWRRWHISLSTWLHEYLYFPLGGNRKGPARAAINRIIVFFLCGLWHGANWTFVVWGLCHGMLLLLENVIPIRRLPRVLGHIYTVLLVMLTFVIFRCDTLSQSFAIIATMFVGWNMSASTLILAVEQLTPYFICMFVFAVILCGSLPARIEAAISKQGEVMQKRVGVACYVASIALLFVCMMSLSAGTYNPFIYFRF